MKRISYNRLAFAAIVLAAVGTLAGVAAATPDDDSAVLFPRTFNDCPFTAVASNNAYPGLISFDETDLVCSGGQNMHVWNFSANGGLTPMVLSNVDDFRMGVTLVLDKGSSVQMEGGLLVSPWWAPNTDGYFNVRLPDGEIAVFGGRLPFYSFSAPPHSIRYSGGPIYLEILYRSNCLTELDPGTVVYTVGYNGQTYSSPALPFGCNVAEEPVHGCWGILHDVQVGGRAANQMWNGGPANVGDHNVHSFFDVFFEPLVRDCPVPAQSATWGQVKASYR